MFMRPVSLLIAVTILSVSTTVTVAKSALNNQGELSPTREQLIAQNQVRRGLRTGKIIEQLNLTTEQQQQIAEIRQKYQGQLQPLREKIKVARAEMSNMMSGTATGDEIRDKHQEILTLHQQIGNIRFEILLETREILTPEQRTKFAQLMEQRRQNFRQRWSNN